MLIETKINFKSFEDLKEKVKEILQERYEKPVTLEYYSGYGNLLRGNLGKDLVEIHLSYCYESKCSNSFSIIFI